MIQPETIAGRKAYFNRLREQRNSNWYTTDDGVVHIPLDDNHEALIDSQDKELASHFSWRLATKKNKKLHYAETATPEEYLDQFGEFTSLHRVVMSARKGDMLDHRNGNGLDCRRSNLRFCTVSQNTSHRHYNRTKLPYRGVVKQTNRWHAQIEIRMHNHYLGIFRDPESAARCYNSAAQYHFGEFAVLNVLP